MESRSIRLARRVLLALLLGSAASSSALAQEVSSTPSKETTRSAGLGGFVAIVEGDPITRTELERAFRMEWSSLVKRYSPKALREQEGQIRRRVLKDLVMRKLLLQRCDKELIEATDEDVDRRIDYDMRQLQDQGHVIRSRREYYKIWESENGSSGAVSAEKEVRSFISENIRIGQLYRRYVFKDEWVSPQELRAYYEKHREEFSTEPTYVFRMILIWASNVNLQVQMQALQDDLKKPIPFADLVARYSEGPLAQEGGLYTKTDKELQDFIEPLPRAIRSLEPGTTSPVIRSSSAFHIIHLERREAGELLAFDEAQERIRDQILSARRAQQGQRFEKELSRNANIEILVSDSPTPAGD